MYEKNLVQEFCPKCGEPMDYPDIEGEKVIIRCINPDCFYEFIPEDEANDEE